MYIYQVFIKNGTEPLKKRGSNFFDVKIGTDPPNRNSWQLCFPDCDAIHANLSAKDRILLNVSSRSVQTYRYSSDFCTYDLSISVYHSSYGEVQRKVIHSLTRYREVVESYLFT